jgi:hypothetical protein
MTKQLEDNKMGSLTSSAIKLFKKEILRDEKIA